MKAILGKKIGMTQVFTEDGTLVPVTVIEAGPCHVLRVKTLEKDGYAGVQLGFGSIKESSVNKPLSGYFKKLNVKPVRHIKEVRTHEPLTLKPGDQVALDFEVGTYVDITGTSIGKGFQGGVKRYHWRGGKASHGSMHHRQVGSVGASSFPSRIFKGHHMPGRMGGDKVTVQNLEVVKVDKENNLLIVKGAVPGCENGFLLIKESIKMKGKKRVPGVKPKPAAKKDVKKAPAKKEDKAPKKK